MARQTRKSVVSTSCGTSRPARRGRSRKNCDTQRTILARLCRRLTAVDSERSLVDVVCDETEALFGWDFYFLAHRPPGQRKVRIVSFVDTEAGDKREFPGGIEPAGRFSQPVRDVLKGKPLLINRQACENLPVLNRVGTNRRSASLIFAPVRCGRRVVGLLTVQSYTVDRYGESDLQLLQQVADIIAPALERVYAEEALRRAHQELEVRVHQRTAELKAANALLRQETRERKAALEAMRRSEVRFRAVTENSLNGVYVMDKDKRFLYVNSAFGAIVGYTPEELTAMGEPMLLIHPDDRPRAAERIGLRIRGEVERDQHQFRAIHKDGRIVHCEVLGRYMELEGRRVIVGNMLDVTARVRAEKALRRSERSLRRLTIEMDRQLEWERARIARELHDGVGQVLTALNMNLAWLEKRASESDEAVKARLGESIGHVGQLTSIVRSLCKSLHPVVLDHHGLAEALQSQVTEFEQYSRIPCEFSIRPTDLELGKPLAIAVFRIVQEALTNVARHSGASRCWASVQLDGGAVVIVVRDDGVGAPPARLFGGKSLGILGMKERAAAVGGTFQIENCSEGGIHMSVRLPLARPEKAEPAEYRANGRKRPTTRQRSRVR